MDKITTEAMKKDFNSLLSFAISVLPSGDYNFVVSEDENCIELSEITSETSKYRGKKVVNVVGELSTDKGVVIADKLSCVDTAVLMNLKPGDKFRISVAHKLREDGSKGQITSWTPLAVHEAALATNH